MSIGNQTETMADDLSLNGGEFSMNKSESEIYDEVDHIPLKQRLKILLSSNPEHESDVLERETKRLKRSPVPTDSAIKTEEAQCHLQEISLGQSAACLAGEVKYGRFSQEKICAFADRAPETNAAAVPKEIVLALPAACFAREMKTARVRKRNAGVVRKVATKVGSDMGMRCSENVSTYQDEDLRRNCNIGETQANKSTCSNQIICPEAKGHTLGLEKLDANIHSLPEHPTLSTPTIKVKVEHSDNDLMGLGRHGAIVEPIKVKTEIHDQLGTDELDHIPLKERQRMLLSRQSMGTV
ncbi:hypothetical protein BVC80_7819g4 [Macleaya cordata]|uniref:Uncharacterized protein n=1 Tax=Macleaya cordata TaxID=56857 RepID=A0A200QFQ7_MACCD|nr:hypothetical protein BVC80_7819g4 [Macleaya cordata]